jgi:S1-C subfamily serine protease
MLRQLRFWLAIGAGLVVALTVAGVARSIENLYQQEKVVLPVAVGAQRIDKLTIQGNSVQDFQNHREAIWLFRKTKNLKPYQIKLQIARSPFKKNIRCIIHREHLSENILQAIVRITIKEAKEISNIGTGWVIKREGDMAWIVTTRKVVSDRGTFHLSNNIEVEFYNDPLSRHQVTIVAASEVDSEIDLTVLKVTGIPQDIEPLEVERNSVSLLTEVLVVGHPNNVPCPWHVVSGEISNYNPQNATLAINAALAFGNAGSPVINRQTNQVVGLITGIKGAFGKAHHIRLVWRTLQKWNVVGDELPQDKQCNCLPRDS